MGCPRIGLFCRNMHISDDMFAGSLQNDKSTAPVDIQVHNYKGIEIASGVRMGGAATFCFR